MVRPMGNLDAAKKRQVVEQWKFPKVDSILIMLFAVETS